MDNECYKQVNDCVLTSDDRVVQEYYNMQVAGAALMCSGKRNNQVFIKINVNFLGILKIDQEQDVFMESFVSFFVTV